MMLFRRDPRTATSGAGTVFSVLVHALGLLIAIHATAVSARELESIINQRLAYLPPPDRRPATPALDEHLRYVDIGGGAVIAETGQPSTALLRVQGGPAPEDKAGGNAGEESKSQHASEETVSPDSVYSMLEVEQIAARIAGSAAPVYPPDLMKRRVEGSAFVRFVVDTSGHADPSTIQIISATHELFAQSVRNAVPLMIFSRALVGGHPVRQAAEQNFRFALPAPVAEGPRRGSRP